MATTCFPVVRGKVMRLTRLDECGAPVEGACSTVVSDGFVRVNASPNIEEGEEYLVKNADGRVCVIDRGCPEIKYIDVELEFCKVDPDLFSMALGTSTENNYAGQAVGFRVDKDVSCDEGFGLEVWTGIPSACTGGIVQYGYLLLPWVTNGIIGDIVIENGVTTFTLSGQARYGGAWGVGPYDVVPLNVGNTPAPLTAEIGATDLALLRMTTIAPPAASCGCSELVIGS